MDEMGFGGADTIAHTLARWNRAMGTTNMSMATMSRVWFLRKVVHV
jgi:hypothetical protein